MFESLREITDGDEVRMQLYFSTYKEGIGEYIILLKNAIEGNDFEKILYATHVSKPLFSVMGFTELYELADEIALAIDSKGDLSDIPGKASNLISGMEKSLEDVTEFSS